MQTAKKAEKQKYNKSYKQYKNKNTNKKTKPLRIFESSQANINFQLQRKLKEKNTKKYKKSQKNTKKMNLWHIF